MASEKNVFTLVNTQNGNLAFKLYPFENNSHFDHVQRLNYYTILLLLSGTARLNADFSEYKLSAPAMLFFSVYQPFMLSAEADCKGLVLHFHSDFFCIHKHHHEVACNGVLFNNIYKQPYIVLSEEDEGEFLQLIMNIRKELQNPDLAHHELLVSYLKILLIRCSRIRLEQQKDAADGVAGKEPPLVLHNLIEAIEAHFRKIHAPADYASLLNISPKALAKIIKNHFQKTLGKMISERIMIEAKRELYLTSKPVKAIAFELGFDDEYYFSRLFKKHTSVSPQLYRETVGFAKAEMKAAV